MGKEESKVSNKFVRSGVLLGVLTRCKNRYKNISATIKTKTTPSTSHVKVSHLSHFIVITFGHFPFVKATLKSRSMTVTH